MIVLTSSEQDICTIELAKLERGYLGLMSVWVSNVQVVRHHLDAKILV
mgnify:CR=1 FL=1